MHPLLGAAVTCTDKKILRAGRAGRNVSDVKKRCSCRQPRFCPQRRCCGSHIHNCFQETQCPLLTFCTIHLVHAHAYIHAGKTFTYITLKGKRKLFLKLRRIHKSLLPGCCNSRCLLAQMDFSFSETKWLCF